MTTDRTIRSFNRIFAGLRETFDLSRLDCGGVNMWPIVRLAGFYAHEQICDSVQRPPATGLAVSHTSVSIPAEPKALVELGAAVLYGAYTQKPVDLLVLQSHRETAETLDDATGSFRRNAFAAAGMRCAALVGYAPGLATGTEPDCWHYAVRPRQTAIAVEPDFVMAVADICAWFNREARGDLLQAAHVVALAFRLHALLPGCGAVLDRFAPRIIFTNGAFSLEKMAMLAAARQRGILCVDHQHGIYSARSETFMSPLPPATSGIDPSPHIAWVWSDWFKSSYGGAPLLLPRVVGGCLFGNASPVGSHAAANPDSRTVLYLHQGLVSAYDPSPILPVPGALLSAMRAGPPGWRWLVRLHPRWRGAAQDTQDRLRAALGTDGPRVEVVQPTGATLAGCFDRSDVVCSGFSASACEAYDAGLPVVLHHVIARDLFGTAIDDGLIGYADNPDALITALACGVRRSAQSFFVRYDATLATAAMRELHAWTARPSTTPSN